MIWNGYASEDKNIAIIANCSDIPHDKNEIIRIPWMTKNTIHLEI